MQQVDYGGDRVGEYINVGATFHLYRPAGSYGFPIYVVFYCNGKAFSTQAMNNGGNTPEPDGTTLYASKKIESSATISVNLVCGQTGGCTKTTWGLANNAISFGAYNPWSDPTPGHNVKCKVNNNVVSQVKPDTTVTITWTAGTAGTGNSIGYYSVNYNRRRNGSWSGRSALTSNTTSTSFSYDLNNLNLRPGDIIKFDVDTYINSSTAGHDSGWWYNNDTQNTGNINVYKDGIIYYKDSNGSVHECTKGYYKDSTGTIRKLRYVNVKDSSGAIHVIDVYTTKYE